MSFSFNFPSDLSENNQENTKHEEKTENIQKHDLEAAREILISDDYDVDDYHAMELKLGNGEVLEYIESHMIEEKLKEEILSDSPASGTQSLASALQSGSDLQPNIYEGGLKIWECSIDLVEHLVSEDIKCQDLSVLELGCGAGLPGLYMYTKGASVHFTDYNWEVLKYITIPNMLLNTDNAAGDEKKRCRFFSGDWDSVRQLLSKENIKYDVILTSETIYNTDNYKKLLTTMSELLKPTGTIYIAAKTYYFGVGGGTDAFESQVKIDNIFTITSQKMLGNGIQRKIVEMKFSKT